jgi:hypothetical protein
MTPAVAWQMIRAAYKCAGDLQVVMRALKESCPPEEYVGHARAIAMSIASLNLNLMEPALKAHPDLQERIDSDMARFDRLMD